MKDLILCALVAAAIPALAVSAGAAGGRLRAVVSGTPLPAARVTAITVDADTLTFDVATIVFNPGRGGVPGVGEDVSVEAVTGGAVTSIFKGEIVGLEPTAGAAQASAPVVVRAFNRLHRLARASKTRTFDNQTDAEIAGTIAREAGLELAASADPLVRHDHVFQHNQTDLEFLKARASAIGFDVWVEDRTLNFRRRREPAEVALGCAPTKGDSRALLALFHPRTTGRSLPSTVTVRGLDAATGGDIVATASRPLIPLSPGAGSGDRPGTTLDLGVVQALTREGSTHGAAAGTLAALTALDLGAEADSDGSPALHAGVRVSLSQANDRFNGAYYVTGVSHRYQKGSDSGYHTLLRLVRADRGMFFLPEVGDEVLVAFEHGDLSRPFVVGSLWDTDERPPQESPFCESR